MFCDTVCCEGEIKVCELEKVFCYDTYSNHKSGQTGTLFVTNYKVSFVTLKFDTLPKYVVGFIALWLVPSNLIFT